MSDETIENEVKVKDVMLDDTSSVSAQFVLEEIMYLREEIKYRTLEQSAIERNSILAIVAIYAALATLDSSKIDKDLVRWTGLFWWLPFLLIVYGRARFFDHGQAIRRIGNYIDLREKLLHPLGGWQTYRHEPLIEKAKEKRTYYFNWKVIKAYWIIMPVVTAVLASLKTYAWLAQVEISNMIETPCYFVNTYNTIKD